MQAPTPPLRVFVPWKTTTGGEKRREGEQKEKSKKKQQRLRALVSCQLPVKSPGMSVELGELSAGRGARRSCAWLRGSRQCGSTSLCAVLRGSFAFSFAWLPARCPKGWCGAEGLVSVLHCMRVGDEVRSFLFCFSLFLDGLSSLPDLMLCGIVFDGHVPIGCHPASLFRSRCCTADRFGNRPGYEFERGQEAAGV